MAIYMEYDGVKGDATDSGHEGWIKLDSFQFGVGRGISSGTGSGDNREATKASLSEITVSKVFDASSGGLLNQALQGVEGKVVKVDFTATNDNTYMSYEFEHVIVSGFSISIPSNSAPSESLSLNYVKMMSDVKEQDTAGTGATGGNKVSYDIAAGKAG